MVITVQTKDYNNTKGISPYTLTSVEQTVGYKAKIPLINKEFEYPIQQISIDFMKLFAAIPSYYAKGIIINESYYTIEDGNLYFTKSLEEIISEQYLQFETVLEQANPISTTIYYEVNILFDRFVPDTTDETNSWALAQATSYALMDYFNQYTYAEVTANMISEIAYTETLTFWSTFISAPLVFLGSWAIMGTETFLIQSEVLTVKALLNQFVGQFLTAPIKEVIQEIVEDGFTEAIAENFVDLIGGTEDLGFWVSSLLTSRRELGGALSTISQGKASGGASLNTMASVVSARLAGNTEIKTQILAQLKAELVKKKQRQQDQRAKMSTWQKLISSNAFKGIIMMVPSLFFGGSSFLTLLGFNSILNKIQKAPQLYGETKTEAHVEKKTGTTQKYDASDFSNNLDRAIGQMKRPSGIDGGVLSNIFRSLQKSGTTTETSGLPSIEGAPRINPNPKVIQESRLEQKFGEIDWQQESEQQARDVAAHSFKERWLTQPGLLAGQSVNLLFDFSVKKDISISNLIKNLNLKKDETKITVNKKEISIETFDSIILTPKDIVHLGVIRIAAAVDMNFIINAFDDFQTLFPGVGKNMIFKYYSTLFNREFESKDYSLKGFKKIPYNKVEFAKAIEAIQSKKYLKYKIIVDNAVNFEVLSILRDKYLNNEQFTKLEGLIADVAIIYMGNKYSISSEVTLTQEENMDRTKESYSTLQASTTGYIQDLESYSTLELIDDIIDKLGKQPEAIANMFPEKSFLVSKASLSQFWEHIDNFVANQLYESRARRGKNPNFNPEDLTFLNEKSLETYGLKALGITRAISDYNDGKLTIVEFTEKVRDELGRINVKISLNELSKLFGKGDNYISMIESRIRTGKTPDFQFSREVLDSLKQNLLPQEYAFRNVLKLIQRYEIANPDLKDYSQQKYTITNPGFFSDPNNVETSYWFGFITDGWITKDAYVIGLQLAVKDEKHLQKFADAVGFSRERIFPRFIFDIDEDGKIKEYEQRTVSFACKPMWQNLKDLGLYGSKSDRKAVPPHIVYAVEMAKKEAKNLDIHWSDTKFGKIAFAWLLGIYDADGTHNHDYTAEIIASSRDLLLEIKDLFESPNLVRTKTEPGTRMTILGKTYISKGMYRLTIGADVFRRMLASYENSLQRKRPD